MNVLKKNKRIIFMLALITGVASVPLMTDYVLEGSSLAATLGQIRVMSEGLGKAFPLRLGTLGSMDYGYSAASFQANVFFLIPALLHLLGMGIGGAYKWTLFLCNLATAVIAYLCVKKAFHRQEIGLVGSMLYTWNHYRCSEMYLVGDLGEIAAWSFWPILLLGLKMLFSKKQNEEDYGGSWCILTLGFSLIAISSTVVLFAAGVVFVLVCLIMGKVTWQKHTLFVIIKTGVATFLLNAWFLIPMLLRLRDVSAVAPLLVKDVRGMGMYITQYLTTFPRAGGGTGLVEGGLKNVQAMGPGIAVTLLVILCMGLLFTGRFSKVDEHRLQMTKKTLLVGAVLVILSTNAFPWDFLQNKNMLFSILLALMYTPAKLGIGAGAVFIFAVCMLLELLADRTSEKEYNILLLLTTAVSFGTTQFLLGNILMNRRGVPQEGIEAMSTIEFPLILQESMIWRLSEMISLLAVAGLIVMGIIRRRKSVKRV